MSLLRRVPAIYLAMLVSIGCTSRNPVSKILGSIVDTTAPDVGSTSLPEPKPRSLRWFTEPPRTPLRAVWGADADHVWAAGTSGTIV